MHLSNIGLINWHLFPLTDLPVTGDVIGIAGENKTGKSTILDAIQVVMTGCDESKMKLNRIASQKGADRQHRRSAHAYSLGRLSVTDTIRDESITYVMLSFEDPKGVRPPVTIGVGLEARKSENAVHVPIRFIAKGIALTTSDFVTDGQGGAKIVKPWSECGKRVGSIVADAGGTLIEFRDLDRAGDYVKEYMHALFPRGRTSSQVQFVKTFINAVTLMKMESATDFVREYLLEKDPIKVTSLRESIRLYREAAETVERLGANLDQLRDLLGTLDNLQELEFTEDREKWIALRARLAAALGAYRAQRRKRSERRASFEKVSRELAQCTSEIGRYRDEIAELQQRRRERLSEDRQALLKSRIQVLDNDYRTAISPGTETAPAVMKGLEGFLLFKEQGAARLLELIEEARHLLPKHGERWPSRAAERLDLLMPMIEESLEAAMRPAIPLLDEKSLQFHQAVEERETLKRQVEAARAGRLVLEPNVEAMVNRLTAEGMRPRVLAELVEVVNEDWAVAAEGYLGIDRETIFVDPEHNRAATDILSNERAKYRRVRIANTRKLKDMPDSADKGTLASVMHSDDRLARAFLVHRTGRINLAQARPDLDRPGRWIMRDGTYDDGVVIDVKDLRDGRKLGAKARMATAEEAATRLEKLNFLIEGTLRRELDYLRRLEGAVTQFREWSGRLPRDADGTPVLFREMLTKSSEIDRQRVRILAEIGELERADVSDIDRDLSELKQGLQASEEEEKGLREQAWELDRDIKQAHDMIEAGDGALGSRMHVRFQLNNFRRGRKNLAAPGCLKAYNERRRQVKGLTSLADDAEQRSRNARDEALEERMTGRDKARACITALGAEDTFEADLFRILLTKVRPWAVERAQEIENETLVHYQHELNDARTRTNDIFRNSFVNELAARFAKVRAELADIRDVLKKYTLLEEIYDIKSEWAPGYEPFHRIVERQRELELTNMPLFKGEVDDGDKLADDLRVVQSVLLAEDVDIAAYEDYTRYFVFEIEIRNTNTGRVVTWSQRKHTGSGAELQTPYYVTLLSALSSVYYGGARSRLGEDDGGLCLAVFDEAFSNMDEAVRLQVVRFCLDLGLQLLICGPDGGRRSMERYAHTIVDIWKSGDQSFARVDVIKQRTRDELADIDPSRFTRDHIEGLLAAAE
ncbi:SbcC/MukB-like Walker B domain-containing protein [Microvirga massiliensis]|uniref:SbcC/MukB-like Walker B domain-containing protein n=1 Tax=Microvirga massiliensis TaxID=1033741 RepID=UPI00062B49E4|nr:SbcC/MukB-like Walker B domain-containing protein [Microvirga massiliensis]